MTIPIRRHIKSARASLEEAQKRDSPKEPITAQTYGDWKWEREELIKSSALLVREAIEIIGYSKIFGRENMFNGYEMDKWQPRQVVELLRDLTDDGIVHDSTVTIRKQNNRQSEIRDGEVGVSFAKKGISIKDLNKLYHKLGQLLHIPVPKNKSDFSHRIANHTKALSVLEEALNFIEKFESSSDFALIPQITWECGGVLENGQSCRERISRPEKVLASEPVISCPTCRFDYRPYKDEGGWGLYKVTPSFDCPACKKEIAVPIEEVALLRQRYQRKLNPFSYDQSTQISKKCSDTSCKGKILVSFGIDAISANE